MLRFICAELIIFDLFINNYSISHKVHIDYVNELRDIIKNLSKELTTCTVDKFISRLLYDNISMSKGRYEFLQEYVKFLKCFCI